jgi:D-glutamate cyclase
METTAMTPAAPTPAPEPETLPAFENLDRLAVVEMRPPTSPTGIVAGFYQLARPAGTPPLTYQIAEGLLARADGGSVLLVTGLVDAVKFPDGEIDGPIGSAVLARALTGLGMRVTVIVDEEAAPAMRRVCTAAGGDRVNIVTLSVTTADQALDFGAGFDVVVAIEKLGRNSAGSRHLIWGTRVEDGDPYGDEYVLGARQAGRATYAIGDNGNEIGFGVIGDRAEAFTPSGVQVDGGFFAATPVDVLLPASVSNFGCYAVVAALAILTGRQELAPEGPEIVRLTQAGLDAGLRSGGVNDPAFQGDDGVPLRFVGAYAEMLAGVVHQALLGSAWLAVR